MNQTMKMALAVLGFSSLLALTIPANFNSKKTEDTPLPAPQPLEVPKLEKPLNQVPVQNVSDDSEEEEDTSFSFGDPTSNAEPIGYDDGPSNNKTNDDIDITEQETGTIKLPTAHGNAPSPTPGPSEVSTNIGKYGPVFVE